MIGISQCPDHQTPLVMKFTLYIFFIILLNAFIHVDANGCNLIEDKSASLQLYRYLFCEYESSERPTKDPKNATSLNIILIPRMIDFEDFTGILNVHTWMYITWEDQHLHWDMSNFGGMDFLWVQSVRIWTPDLAIGNPASADSAHLGIPTTNCMLSYLGKIVCVSQVVFSTRCQADYSYWPYDRLNCSIELSSWSYASHEITYKNDKFHIFMEHYTQNAQWNIESVDTGYINKKSKYKMYDEFPTLVAHFILQRSDTQLWRVFGTPTAILATMTLTTLWLDPKSNERLLIGCINFSCHFLCVGNLHWVIPRGDSIPNILIFYHNSIILAVVALILTCVFRKILNIQNSPPFWISSFVSMILSSKVGQFLLLSILDPKASALIDDDADDNSNLVNSQNPKKSTWTYVTIILGWISFMSFLLTYIIMFAVLLQMPSPVKSNLPTM